jgi:hypothetical protein
VYSCQSEAVRAHLGDRCSQDTLLLLFPSEALLDQFCKDFVDNEAWASSFDGVQFTVTRTRPNPINGVPVVVCLVSTSKYPDGVVVFEHSHVCECMHRWSWSQTKCSISSASSVATSALKTRFKKMTTKL